MDSHQAVTELTTAETVCERGNLSKGPWVPLLNKWAPGPMGHFSDYLHYITTDSPPIIPYLNSPTVVRVAPLLTLCFEKDILSFILCNKAAYTC